MSFKLSQDLGALRVTDGRETTAVVLDSTVPPEKRYIDFTRPVTGAEASEIASLVGAAAHNPARGFADGVVPSVPKPA